ncbi:MAG: acylneuraminate cytidylyltransferase family protein [bacterium]|nr:acylneuraminate cytidylyltransferase family protein [bacterium]
MTGEIKNPKRELVEVVALIPARGGQQSVEYKNLQKLGGKTLLAWAVEVALAAEKIDAVVVSTEDERIADEAKKLGVAVAPRPAEFSRPESGDAGWYRHAVEWMEKEFGWQPEYLVNLRPTSPLRFAADIDKMIEYIKSSGADGVKSVIPAPMHPYKMWLFQVAGSIPRRPKGYGGQGQQVARDDADTISIPVGFSGKLNPVFDNDFRQQHGPDQPRQKIQEMFPVFWQDGQVDITRRKFVLRPEALERENIWGDNLHGYVLDPRTSTDLDEPKDFVRAEKIYEEIEKERGVNK